MSNDERPATPLIIILGISIMVYTLSPYVRLLADSTARRDPLAFMDTVSPNTVFTVSDPSPGLYKLSTFNDLFSREVRVVSYNNHLYTLDNGYKIYASTDYARITDDSGLSYAYLKNYELERIGD